MANAKGINVASAAVAVALLVAGMPGCAKPSSKTESAADAMTKVSTRLMTPMASVLRMTRKKVVSEKSCWNLARPINFECRIPSLGL